MRPAADVVDPGDPLGVGAGGDDRLGPGVQVVQELVQVVTERVEHRPFELVGADLDLLPERPAGVGELLAVVISPRRVSRSNPASMSAPVQPRVGA